MERQHYFVESAVIKTERGSHSLSLRDGRGLKGSAVYYGSLNINSSERLALGQSLKPHFLIDTLLGLHKY